MRFSSAILSIALLATSAFGAPTNQKRCRAKASSSVLVSTSTAILAASSTDVHTTSASISTEAASTSEVHTTAASTAKVVSTAAASTSKVASTEAASTSKIATTAAASTSKAATTAAASTKASTHTSAPAATSTSSSSSSGIKRGLSYNDVSLTKGFSSSKVSWAYNWFSQPGGTLASGVNYFPMLWGADSGHTSTWMADAKAAIAKGSTHLLFLNEPDLSSQSNVDPTTAAQLWMTYMQPFKGQATLVGPAITNGGAPLGTAWLDQFMDACNKLGCQVDAVAGHIYGSASDPDYYKTYITSLGTRYGKPVLMTEIGVSDTSTSAADQAALIDELVPFLDGLDSVSHYAWFMAAANLLVDADGSLNAVGAAYENAA
ncbi:glycosyl hydrolase catalytic core-domain-containing protein [Dichomitus squalens]|uniref:Glycosyl hydrolase catalytic core-domain-containing protein n=1 Tax=Dichomitus squalens TaxID=114155 RepID=A0A4Q9P9M9_9APHY|nr:glycosyl hydrolase catalytic core-domain-containing protein [Dichomitus squalens]